MLTSLTVRGFKSLVEVGPIDLAPLTVLFGPNDAGKSNLADALLVLSRLATHGTLPDVPEDPVRSLPVEHFSIPDAEGLPALLKKERAYFRLTADIELLGRSLRYEIQLVALPREGGLHVEDERLIPLTEGEPGEPILKHHRGKWFGQPSEGEKVRGAGVRKMTLLSRRAFSGQEWSAVEEARKALAWFRSYHFDPRTVLRSEPKLDLKIEDVGPRGELLVPFLARLRQQVPRAFEEVRDVFCTMVGAEDLLVDIDRHSQLVDLKIQVASSPWPARLMSEGSLRILAMLCAAANPWGGRLVVFEEPENGLDPKRVELLAGLLGSLAAKEWPRRQVIVTTHSPLLCTTVSGFAGKHPAAVRVYRVRRRDLETRVSPIDPLAADDAILAALRVPGGDRVFEELAGRGRLDT